VFNPFYPLTGKLLEAFVAKGKTYFVRQTFNRAKSPLDEGIKGYFLFSHYDNLTTAQDHFGAIRHDPNRFLYDWGNHEHREKLRIAASGLKEYRNYASVLRPDYEKGITDQVKKKIRQYVSDSLGWQIKGSDTLDTNFELQFGELFMRFKHGSRQAKVKFEEIEKRY
jgi:hypothetical protein